MRSLLVMVLALAQAPPGDAVPAVSTRVPVPVVVHDTRDRAVTGLTAADFEVTSRGARMPVVDVTFVPVATSADGDGRPAVPAAPAVREATASGPAGLAGIDVPPLGDARFFAFFLDEYHVAPAAAVRVRQILTDFIGAHTSDRDWFLVVRPLDPLLSLAPQRGRTAALAAVAAFEGRAGDYQPRNAFERDLIAADPVRIDRARTRIAAAAIQAVATRLGGIGPTRKAFLIVSEGIAGSPGAGRTGEVFPTVDAIVRAAHHGNISISVLDPRATAADGRADSDADERVGTLLAELTRLTDGRRVRPPLDAGLRQIAGDLGAYYLVTFTGADDGQFHPLDVRVGRPGVRVRARPGYWAVSADDLARLARATAPAAARPVQTPLRTSRLIVPWIGQERGDQGRTRLTVVWEPAPGRAGERARVLPPSRVVLTARAADGETVFEGTIQSGSSGFGPLAVATFEAAAGRVRLQMAIEDASARVLDTDVREVVVGALRGPLAFGTPRVYRARTAREFKALMADPAAPPAASRTFTRVERLLVRIPLYDASTAPSTVVQAALLNRAGHVMRSLPVTRLADMSFVVTDLSLAGLAAGEYSVQWRATNGPDEARETVSLRVTS